MLEAARWACDEVAAVRDDTAARIELLERTYHGPAMRLPYRRAALSFMRWQARRGVLEPADAQRPGSPWWRAVNERLLRDACESVALATVTGTSAAGAPEAGSGALDGPVTEPSTAVEMWIDFVRLPSARRWYRAHNASIVSAYLENRDLAAAETEAERFFINVALMRVLYAHALVAAPSLALGRCAPLGGVLGDPRLGMAGAFLSLGRVLPDFYPLNGQLTEYLREEHGLGRLLDYAVIGPRLRQLYAWSAAELRLPGLEGFLRDGLPAYCWPAERADAWRAPPPSFLARLFGRATAPPPRLGEFLPVDSE